MLAQLGFQLFDALFRGLLHGGGGTRGIGFGGLKSYEMAGVALAPAQHGAAPLDAVASLGLFITQLAAAHFAHHGQFKGQAVVAQLRFVLHDILGKGVNI